MNNCGVADRLTETLEIAIRGATDIFINDGGAKSQVNVVVHVTTNMAKKYVVPSLRSSINLSGSKVSELKVSLTA